MVDLFLCSPSEEHPLKIASTSFERYALKTERTLDCVPASVGGLQGATQGSVSRADPAGGAVGISAAALPCSSGLQDGYLSGGPAPAPAPTGVLGNRSRYALPREPPPSALAEPLSGRGHMERGSRPLLWAPPSLSSPPPGKLFPVFPTPSHSLLFRGTLASLNRL